MVNWHDLATTSHYQTAVAIKHALSAGAMEHARIGIENLIEALARSDRRALESYLIRLMQHIIKWCDSLSVARLVGLLPSVRPADRLLACNATPPA